MPKVSVVIPNYNHARFLARRIESVLQQTYRDFEVVLLDDCSNDDSRAILSSYARDPRVRIEFNAENSGSTFKQWNKGVAMARGEYVWIAESDDYADSRLLDRLVGQLDANAKLAFAYCRSWRVSADGHTDGFADDCLAGLDANRWNADYRADGREECLRYFVYCNIVVNASAVVFRKSVYEAVGPADEALRMGGDWKLWASMALTGELAYVAEPLNYFRFHGESVRGRDRLLDELTAETLVVVHWLLGKLAVSGAALEDIRQSLAGLWIPCVTSRGLPLARRWAIFESAMSVDPYAPFRLIRSIVQTTVRHKARVAFWHPLLDATRPVRHVMGIRRKVKTAN